MDPESIYEKGEEQRKDEQKLTDQRPEKAVSPQYETVESVRHEAETNEMGVDKETPSGLKPAGIKFKGRDTLTKEACKEIAINMAKIPEEDGDKWMKEAEILEEEIKVGKAKRLIY